MSRKMENTYNIKLLFFNIIIFKNLKKFIDTCHKYNNPEHST